MEIITFEENIKYLPSFIQTDGFKCIVKSNKTICRENRRIKWFKILKGQ